MVDQREGWTLQLCWRLKLQCNATPDQLHQLQNDVGQAKGDQQLGDMAKLVYFAQAHPFKQCAKNADDDGCDDQGRPKADKA